jgi:hypothetical protein
LKVEPTPLHWGWGEEQWRYLRAICSSRNNLSTMDQVRGSLCLAMEASFRFTQQAGCRWEWGEKTG